MSLRRPPNIARHEPSEASCRASVPRDESGDRGECRRDMQTQRVPPGRRRGRQGWSATACWPPWTRSPSPRTLPRFNLSRLELGGAPFLDESALRFRWWEVDRLFTEVYGDPLHPGDVLPLTRLTEGRAAFLHMLYLGTRGRSLAERRRALA